MLLPDVGMARSRRLQAALSPHLHDDHLAARAFVGGAVRDTVAWAGQSPTSIWQRRCCPGSRSSTGWKLRVSKPFPPASITAPLPRLPRAEITKSPRFAAMSPPTGRRRATGRVFDRLARRCGAARFYDQRPVCRSRYRRDIRLFRWVWPTLTTGIVRFIGDADERIAEDHPAHITLFPLSRALRSKGDCRCRAAIEACAKGANGLTALSRERIAQ